MVNAGVYLLARFYPAFEGVEGWKTAVMVVGMTSALLAALMALVANDLKRVLAYSTISQLGYMVYAIGVGSVFASQLHLLSHAVFKALLFLAAGAVIHGVGTRDMYKMGGLGKKMPFNRAVFIIGALALAGLPIFNGFWSKELILEHGLEEGPTWAYAGMLAGAGITALYTSRHGVVSLLRQAAHQSTRSRRRASHAYRNGSAGVRHINDVAADGRLWRTARKQPAAARRVGIHADRRNCYGSVHAGRIRGRVRGFSGMAVPQQVSAGEVLRSSTARRRTTSD